MDKSNIFIVVTTRISDTLHENHFRFKTKKFKPKSKSEPPEAHPKLNHREAPLSTPSPSDPDISHANAVR